MVRHAFDVSLENLNLDLVRMASAVEKSIDQSILALKNKDIELAKKVVEEDDIIDDMNAEIEAKCIRLIATQQPLAKDLRLITSILKMITDLERIADQSADISELMLNIREEDYIKPLIDVPKAAEVAREMVKEAIDAYVNKDVELAKKVCKKDEIVDEYYETILMDLKNLMKKNPDNIEQGIILIQVAKYIERISDHATNLAEWVIYIITGKHETLNF
ncbi:Phosphate transport system protein phoU homolog [Proteiniborus sp. DW1]|uniref:phosphate signaling complex protein PhoU n=1 Tax=Proteiniborus sp. DW1 TaxID=1889883 RepID=UPI00092E0344|nr:phosphate signaling complex protein PhoU [Proteiniborus sp. DW1]SCG82566.1 Phosphate transport system protein phoU homolog [Proteiniborus sp. DW1]